MLTPIVRINYNPKTQLYANKTNMSIGEHDCHSEQNDK